MSKNALHKLVDKISDSEVNLVYFLLSRIVTGEEDELLPEEIEAVKEYEMAKERGEKFSTHEEVWGRIEKKRAREKVAI